MLEILEMRDTEIRDLLRQVGYGHLACSRDNQPYVVPIYYAFDGTDIFVYTTAGLKSEIISRNPKVCLQVEEIGEEGSWKSVVVIGEAQEVINAIDRERAVDLVREGNPSLIPALAIKWANDWMRKNVEVVYRIAIVSTSGKFTSQLKVTAAAAKPNFVTNAVTKT